MPHKTTHGYFYEDATKIIHFRTQQTTYHISFDNFKIIKNATNTRLRLLESLYMNKVQPNPNEALPIDVNIL